MSNILEIIKQQIEEQVRKSLETDLTQAKVVGVSNRKEPKIERTVQQVNPSWTSGIYLLQRQSGTERPKGVSPEEFKEAGGHIVWDVLESQATVFPHNEPYTNRMLGVQLYSVDAVSLSLAYTKAFGNVRIYRKDENDSTLTLLHESSTSRERKNISIPIEPNTWNTIIVTYYTNVGGYFAFGSDYSNITSWRHLDVTAPSVPVWATPSIQYNVVQGEVARGKNTLRWNRDMSIDFAGNGIYRSEKYDTGITIQSGLPGTLPKLTTSNNTEDQHLFTVLPNSTLNSSDIISFTSGVTSLNPTVSRVMHVPKNHISNPIFADANTDWELTAGTIKADVTSKRSGSHFFLHTRATSGTYSITSTLISNTLASLYFVDLYTSNELLDTVPYNADGYKSNPSRWTQTGLTTFLSTLHNKSLGVLRTIRSSGDSSQVKSQNATLSFYVSTAATYHLSVMASSHISQPYSFSIRSLADATLFTSPTLMTGVGYSRSGVAFTPSSSSGAYLQFNIPATLSPYNNATIDFGGISLEQTPNKFGNFSELFQIKFYDNAKAQLSTISTLQLDQGPFYYLENTTLGTKSDRSYPGFEFPAAASFFSLGYYATINTGGTIVSLNRRIHGFTAATMESSNINYAVFATPYTLVRTVPTFAASAGSSIYINQSVHIIDRPRQTSDGAIITWDDFEIVPDTTYTYYLDAYDNSPLRNRSSFSVPASVLSGDTTAPKTPTSYTLTGNTGGLYHQWTNPTADDLKSIKIYTDGALTNILAEVSGTGTINTYAELTTSTAQASRYIIAVDTFGNASGSISATGTPLADIANLQFSAILLAGGSPTEPNANGWFNQAITASLMYEGTNAIASYFYSTKVSGDWSAWTEFNGQLTLSTGSNWWAKFRVKDIEENFSGSDETLHVPIDIQQPTWDSQKFKYFNYRERSEGLQAANRVVWDNSKIADGLSGLYKTHIFRSQTEVLNNNPIFQEMKANTDAEHWIIATADNIAAKAVIDSIPFHGDHCFIIIPADGVTAVYIANSNTFKVRDGETITAFSRYRDASNLNPFYGLKLIEAGDGSVVASVWNKSVDTSVDWRVQDFSYIHSSANTLMRLQVHYKTVVGLAGDAFYLEETVAFKGTTFATITSVDAGVNFYVDKEVDPWKDYIYYTQIEDVAGNFSTISDYKYLFPVADYKDKFRNMLDNSSFERVYRTSSGTVWAHGWKPQTYGSTPLAKVEYNNGYNVKSGDAYHGTHYVEIPPEASHSYIAQNDIHVLPYVGNTRKYVFSCYARCVNDLEDLKINILARDNQTQLVKFKSSIYSDIGTTWERVTGTFYIATPSITNISITLGYDSLTTSATLHIDGVQFEEKDEAPARAYYDTKSVTADYLQGNLIRGHMIEADSVITQNVAAEAITANEIETDTITTNELQFRDKNIYLVTKELRIEATPGLLGTGTQWAINLTMGTIDDKGIGYYFVQLHQNPSFATYLHVGWISDTFNRTSSESRPLDSTFDENYNGGYPLIARPYPATDTDTTLMILFASTDSSFAYSSFSDISTNRDLTGDALHTYWGNPTLLSTDADGYVGALRYSDNRYYYMSKQSALASHFTIFKLNIYGSVMESYDKLAHVSGNLTALDFDVSPSGTMLLAYCDSANAEATIYGVCYATTGAVTVATYGISTYGGYGVDAEFTRSELNSFRGVTWVGVGYSQQDQFTLGYRLVNNNYTYYKTFTSAGSIISGNNFDLILSNNNVYPGSNYRYGAFQIRPRMMNTHSDDIVFYIPADQYKDPAGLGIAEETYSLGGKAVFLSKTSPTIQLIDLINRIT